MRNFCPDLSRSGWLLQAEFDVAGEPGQEVVTPLRSYTWAFDAAGSVAGGAGGVGGLVAMTDHAAPGGPKTYQVLSDPGGNVIALIDPTAANDVDKVIASFDYTPYGSPAIEDNPTGVFCPFRFSTKYLDPEIGLYYYGYRYYDPTSGTWLNRDPLQESGGLNLYAFCGNDPVNKIDPVGLEDWSIKTKGGKKYFTWIVEEDGFWGDTNHAYHTLGEVVGDYVILNKSYGGGKVALSDLKTTVGDFWNEYCEMYKWKYWQQRNTIKHLMGRIQKGQFVESQSPIEKVASAAGEGVNVGISEYEYTASAVLNKINIVNDSQLYKTKRNRDRAWRESNLEGTWVQSATQASASISVGATCGAVALGGASFAGITELGTAGLAQVPSLAYAEAYVFLSTGGAATYTMMNNSVPASVPAATAASATRQRVTHSIAQSQAARATSGLRGPLATAPVKGTIQKGTVVTRNWGGQSGPWGQSWTTDSIVTQSRNSLGLETTNTGQFVSHGTVVNNNGIFTKVADSWGRFAGGGQETIIPSAFNKVRLDAVTMPDTPLPWRLPTDPRPLP